MCPTCDEAGNLLSIGRAIPRLWPLAQTVSRLKHQECPDYDTCTCQHKTLKVYTKSV